SEFCFTHVKNEWLRYRKTIVLNPRFLVDSLSYFSYCSTGCFSNSRQMPSRSMCFIEIIDYIWQFTFIIDLSIHSSGGTCYSIFKKRAFSINFYRMEPFWSSNNKL